jgi:uncharacterized protein YjdB
LEEEMKKIKLQGIFCVLILLAIIFTGCSSGGGGNDTDTVNVTGVTLKAGESTSGTSTIYLGSTQAHLPASVTLTATVEPADATNKNVTWTVTPDTYVTWNETTRTATAKAKGGPTTVTVKTADGNFTASWTITVAEAADYVAVTGVTITSEGPFVFVKPVGGSFSPATIQLAYTITPDNATNKGVSWESSDEDVITVSHTGLVTPVGNGTAEITIISDDDITIIDQITVKVNDEAVEDVHVTGVTIVLADTGLAPVGDLTFNKPAGGDFTPEHIHLSVVVSPHDASDKTVEWSSSNDAVATVSENGVVTPVAAGDAIITATSNDNPAKTDAVNIKVTEEFAYSLKLVNMGTPTGTTTTTMPAIDHNNRYTISNAISTAKFVSAGVTDATIVYLDYPAENFSSISARVRIKKANGGSATETGVIMGLMTNPAQPIATRGVNFAGMRVNTAGLWRPFTSRPNIATPSNNSSNLSAQNSSGYSEINSNANSAIDGVAIPFDEEFIIEAERTGTRTNNTAGVYTTRLFSNAANLASATLMASYSTGNNDDIDISVTGKPAYLGFIIANCDVEISQIIIKETTNEIFSTPISTPTPTPVASIEFTAPVVDPTATSGEYECGHSTLSGDLTISVKVLPTRASATVNWNVINGTATLSASTGDNVTMSFTDTNTVAVTASAGGKSIKLTIDVSAGSIPVEGITISPAGGKTIIKSGNGDWALPETLQFSEIIDPPSATDPVVTWSLSSTSAFNAATTVSGCNISAAGLLTAPANYTGADITIYVFAKANNGGDDIFSDGKAIMVKGYDPTIWEWNMNETWANSATATQVNGKTLIRTGGQIPATNGTGISMGASARFTIGTSATTPATTNAIAGPEGEFDFTRSFSITVWYSSITSETGANKTFLVYLNNNTTSAGNSVFSSSNIMNQTNITATSTPGSFTVTVNPSTLNLTSQATAANIDKNAVLAKAWLQFRTDNGISMVVTRMLVKYE